MASYKVLLELVPKRLWILQYEGKRTDYWYVRVSTGDRKYAHRSLKTIEEQVARDKAYEVFAEILTQLKTTGSTSPKTIRNLCDKWIKRQDDRNADGTLSTSLYRAHKHLFSVYVPNYADHKGWKMVKDIPHDGWIEYRRWRKEEGWKLIGVDPSTGKLKSGTNKNRRPPIDSTVNREVTMIQEWFKYLLVPEGLAVAAPVILKAKAQRQHQKRNAAFTPADYTKIQRRFRKWANEPRSHLNQKPEWRQVVYLFFLCSSNVGWRPDSEGLELTWDNIKIRHDRRQLPNGTHKEEVISHIKIWDRKNKREREGNFLGGEYFERLKNFYLQWHKENENFHMPSRTSLVFADPETGKKLTYSRIFTAYKKILASLGMENKYTFYSCRSFYVNERLKEGVEVFTVAKQTGHSMQICNQYYAELDIQARAQEATRRTYGKKREEEGKCLF